MKVLKMFIPIITLCVLLSACNSKDNLHAEHFGFETAKFTVVEEEDARGGFLGDGSYSLVLDCSANSEQAREIVKDWIPLPFSENLELLMYGGEKDGVEYGYFSEQANWPEIRNGVYKFVDRNSDAEDPSDDKEILSRGTANFSIAVYDLDSDMLYYFEADT